MGRRRKKGKRNKAHKKKKKTQKIVRLVEEKENHFTWPDIQTDETFTRCSHSLQTDDVRAVIYEIFYLFEIGLAKNHYAQCKAVTEHYNQEFLSANRRVRPNKIYHAIDDDDHSIEPIFFFHCGQPALWTFIQQYPALCSANIQYLNLLKTKKISNSETIMHILQTFLNFLIHHPPEQFLLLFNATEFDDIDSTNQGLISYLYNDIPRKVFHLISLITQHEGIIELITSEYIPTFEEALIERSETIDLLAQQSLEQYYYYYAQFLQSNISKVATQEKLNLLDNNLKNLAIERPFTTIDRLLSMTDEHFSHPQEDFHYAADTCFDTLNKAIEACQLLNTESLCYWPFWHRELLLRALEYLHFFSIKCRKFTIKSQFITLASQVIVELSYLPAIGGFALEEVINTIQEMQASLKPNADLPKANPEKIQLASSRPQTSENLLAKPSVTLFKIHPPDIDEDDCSDISSSTGSVDAIPIDIPIDIDAELAHTPDHFFMPITYHEIGLPTDCFSLITLKLMAFLRSKNILAFVCGGKTLEALDLKNTQDTDIVITTSLEILSALLIKHHFCDTSQMTISGHDQKSTMCLTFEDDSIDIQTMEQPNTNEPYFGNIWSCLILDAHKRDLGINATYLYLTSTTTAHLYDPCSALANIRNHTLSAAIHDNDLDTFLLPKASILRVIRITLEISIHTRTPYQLEDRIYQYGYIEYMLVLNTSPERRTREWQKIQNLLEADPEQTCIHPTTLSLIKKIEPLMLTTADTSMSHIKLR